MTDKIDTSAEAVESALSLFRHNIKWEGLQDVDREAYQIAIDLVSALAARLAAAEAERDEAQFGHSQEKRLRLEMIEHVEDAESILAKIERRQKKANKCVVALAAAISLLESGGKSAAPSNKMFEQMLTDYRRALEDYRETLQAQP